MKKLQTLLYLAAAMLMLTGQAAAQTPDCPPEGGPGKGRPPLTAEKKEFNRKKNRPAAEPEVQPLVFSINDLFRGTGPVHDREDFSDTAYVELHDAYLMSFHEQGPEDCNCHLATSRERTGDVHINLCTRDNLAAANNNYTLVVEITPSYKALHPGYTEALQALEGKKVIVRGYLFYDDEHERNSVNYCKTCSEKGVWRKTCWEIHPVTYIGEGSD
jgi:hypothetical protein